MDEKSEKQLLQEVMDRISSIRYKFATERKNRLANNSISDVEEKIANAYLIGLDDANRAVRKMMDRDILAVGNELPSDWTLPRSYYGTYNLKHESKTLPIIAIESKDDSIIDAEFTTES